MKRLAILVSIAALLIAAGVALAAPDCTTVRCVYLPVVTNPPPTPTPIPTPIPPSISTLVIQLSEMRSGYTRDTFQEVTNADAAKNYKDPAAAAAAFAQQGRETSWYVKYFSTDYLFSDAIAVANQAYRYLTIEGASQGFQYSLGKTLQDHPDYRPFNVNAPCCPIIGLRRTFTASGTSYDQFYIIVQAGRYVTDVQVIGLTGSISVDRALYYANLALVHLLNTPQALRSDAQPSSRPLQRPSHVIIPRDRLTIR